MVRLVNRLTGGDMWVHEDRVQEYLAAGHRPAAAPAPEPAAEPVKAEKKKQTRRK